MGDIFPNDDDATSCSFEQNEQKNCFPDSTTFMQHFEQARPLHGCISTGQVTKNLQKMQV